MQPIFIGDIQGCFEELEVLLSRADSCFGRDCQINFVGDLVNRGPDNLKVLNVVRELWEQGRSLCVLGNHDLHFLARYWGLRERGSDDTLDDLLLCSEVDDWVEWLRRLPMACTGTFHSRPWVMVHAAVGPDWGIADIKKRSDAVSRRLGDEKLEKARAFLAGDVSRDPVRDDLALMTSCRLLVSKPGGWGWTRCESDLTGSVPWHKIWEAESHDYGIIYGHWAKQGLHSTVDLRGLDTACVHHGRWGVGKLTAWVPDTSLKNPFAVPDESFWQVVAHRAYWRDNC